MHVVVVAPDLNLISPPGMRCVFQHRNTRCSAAPLEYPKQCYLNQTFSCSIWALTYFNTTQFFMVVFLHQRYLKSINVENDMWDHISSSLSIDCHWRSKGGGAGPSGQGRCAGGRPCRRDRHRRRAGHAARAGLVAEQSIADQVWALGQAPLRGAVLPGTCSPPRQVGHRGWICARQGCWGRTGNGIRAD
jgi:hypothetical protein